MRDARPFGEAGALAHCATAAEARALARALEDAGPAALREAVVGLRSVVAFGEAGEVAGPELATWLAGHTPAEEHRRPGTCVEVPVVWGGPDTEEVCRLAGLDPGELAELLSVAPLEVAAVGFSPGFAYLEGVPPALAGVPRRASPRPSVPAGSVALAAGLAAVYPQSTPGGWALVGWTPARLFDPEAAPYALLAPGDSVRFVSRSGLVPDPAAVPPGGRRHRLRAPSGTAAVVIEDPGALSLVQDAGRRGVAHLGVPAAGPADPLSHALANRLVGNAAGAPAVEVTGRGPVVVALRRLHVAVVGGGAVVRVDGRDVGAGHVVPLAPGQRLAVGTLRRGARATLAVAGGVVVDGVLGSVSTDTLSWLGPGALLPGDELGAGPEAPGRLGDHLSAPASALVEPAPGAPWRVRVLPGPHAEWFDPDVLERLAATRYEVAPASSRVGVRLVGERPLGRRFGELASVGMVRGAVQVPPDGMPVVLGPDHATLGGYPVVAVVIAADHWVLGQVRPGDRVTIEPVGLDEAARAFTRLRRSIEAGVAGRYPVSAG